MSGTKRGHLGYPSVLTEALRRAGVQAPTIRSFEAYWNALPPEAEKRPCPLCYAHGYQGWFRLGKTNGAPLRLQCDRCHEHFIVGPVHAGEKKDGPATRGTGPSPGETLG